MQPSIKMTDPNNAMAGWDIGVGAIALACMTTGFWRLWPGAVSLGDAPLGPMILKAGLAALGFVAVATRWEDAARALGRNPLILVLLALACASSIWAIVPADALRNGIMLIVVWCFGVALTLRFSSRELAEICAFAGVFGLLAQFGAHQKLPPLGAFDGDIAFALLGSVWAAWSVPARRVVWMLIFAGCSALALAAGDIASLGAVFGLLVGFGFAQIGALKGRRGQVSIVVTAWAIVAMIIGVTVFALFGAGPVGDKLSRFFSDLGPHVMLGQGFGLAGHSVSSGLGAGLGIVGVAVGGLIVFATLFQALLGERKVGSGLETSVAIWFATLGAILASPSDIAVFGPICIVFAATSFSISFACVSAPRRRQALMGSPQRTTRFQSQPIAKPLNKSLNKPLVVLPEPRTLSALGLRPKN